MAKRLKYIRRSAGTNPHVIVDQEEDGRLRFYEQCSEEVRWYEFEPSVAELREVIRLIEKGTAAEWTFIDMDNL